MSADGYIQAIKGLGVTVLVHADLGFYQGDWVGLIGDGNWSPDRFGFIVIGYGSCSGCDSWEAAGTAEERAEIVVNLLKGAKWFDDLDAAKTYIASDDQALQWYAHEDGWPKFKAAVADADEYRTRDVDALGGGAA